MTRPLPALAAVLAAAALLVSACGSNDTPDSQAAPSSAASADKAPAKSDGKAGAQSGKGSSAATTGYISPKLKHAPVFAGAAAGVFKDVKVSSCDTSKGAVKAHGTVTNTAKVARDIVITMNWAVPTGGDVLARGIAVVPHVAAGKTVAWKTGTTLEQAAPVQCVVTAQAGQLRS